MKGTTTDPIICSDWEEAFSVCRERDRPVVCWAPRDDGQFGYEVARCFPSGRCETIRFTDTPAALLDELSLAKEAR